MKTPALTLLAIALMLAAIFPRPSAVAAKEDEIPAEIKKVAAALNWQTGEVDLNSGLAHVTVPESMHFLGAKDAKVLLETLWGNPPGSDVLGLLAPKDIGPLDERAWAVVITYEDDGHVKDDDASKINYDDLLKDMKESTAAGNEQRKKAGYPAIELVGWAAPPRYDSTAKKLYWAKELKFEGGTEHTLNYGIRVLGKQGVLVLNAVAGMAQLKDVEAATPTILAAVDFKTGNRYADFNPSTDKVATYGLAGLITGGVLAKTGLLAKFGILFAKFFKVILFGGAALVAVIVKLAGKKRQA